MGRPLGRVRVLEQLRFGGSARGRRGSRVSCVRPWQRGVERQVCRLSIFWGRGLGPAEDSPGYFLMGGTGTAARSSVYTYSDRSWATRHWEAGTALSPRALPPTVPGLSEHLLLLSQATRADRQGEETLIPSDLGPDWLGRQDHTVLVSSLSLSLKVSLTSSLSFHPAATSTAIKIPKRCWARRRRNKRKLRGAMST